MKKIKRIFVVSSMLLIGGLVNAGATTMDFTGHANSYDWRTIGTRNKSTNTGQFKATANKVGAVDHLQFRALTSQGYEICRVKIAEGTYGICSYPSDFAKAIGTPVRADVISDTWSISNYPISGTIDFY